MELIRRLVWGRQPEPSQLPTAPEPPTIDPSHVWNQLSNVNEWIRHSDAKATATLAAVGVLATITFSLAENIAVRQCVTDVLLVGIGLLLVASGAACGWTLTPRVRDRSADPATPNRIFFGSVASSFTRDSYRTALRDLATDPDELLNDLADQIHANSAIAATKAKAAKWAIRAALAATLAVAALAIVVRLLPAPTATP